MKVGIIGCTGAVGRQMLVCLEENNLIVEELRLFASERSAGKVMRYKDQNITVEDLNSMRFENLDYVLGAVDSELSRKVAKCIVDSGAIYIDNSSAFRLDENVPLVVPEVNLDDCRNHKGIIANPNCSTIIATVAINAVAKLSKIEKLIVSTYQAVSGAGLSGMQELNEQIVQLSKGQEIIPTTFVKQIAYNCIPQIGSIMENGYTDEEMKLQNEGRKILHLPELKVSCTCVRVPVIRSHSLSITCITKEKVTIEQFSDQVSKEKSVLIDELPTPLDVSNSDIVKIGRIRENKLFDNAIDLWCVGDQVRKGAASNAVQIMMELEKMK